MHMVVDRARQDVKSGCIECLARRRHRFRGADGEDHAILDGDAGLESRVRGNDRAVPDDEICDHATLPLHHSIAQPPSTGRSAPVI
jgi:hypothetical protein